MRQLVSERIARLFGVAVLTLAVCSVAAAQMGSHTSGTFMGPKANTGTVTHALDNGKDILKVSQNFKVPDTPAPTWRIVDSHGNIYTLDAFKIKGGEKRQIEVPGYIHDVAKVQVYCAWAEVLLGEANFPSVVALAGSR